MHGIVTIPSPSLLLFPPWFTHSLRVSHDPHTIMPPVMKFPNIPILSSSNGLTALRGAGDSINQDKQFIPFGRQPESIVSATAYCSSAHRMPGTPQNVSRLHTRLRISPACHIGCSRPANNRSHRSTALHPETYIKELPGPYFLPNQAPLSIHLRFRLRSLKHP